MLAIELFFYPLLFVFGASLGSFYQTVVDRVFFYFYSQERKKNAFWQRIRLLLTNPSHCPLCQKKLSAIQLIPIFGYFYSKNTCLPCKSQIPRMYPWIELCFGLVPVVVFASTSSLPLSLIFPFFLGHLLLSIQTDARYFSLDYENLPFLILFGLLLNFFLTGEWPGLPDALVLFGFGLFYFALYWMVPSGMGLGDVFFAPVFGFLAGHPFWIFFLNSSYSLAIVVTLLQRRKGESLRKKPIPMGVYLSLGLFFTMLSKIFYYHFQIGGMFSNDGLE